MTDNLETFTITCTMNKRWVPHFLSMLKYMQYLGNVGSSRHVALYADGDGDFQPRFQWIESLKCNENPITDNNGNRIYDAG